MADIKYSLGLDIGTTSVGWAILDLDNNGDVYRIRDLGVRIFERPEDPQNGDSLAKPRRDARSARRRLKRRRQRLNNLKDFFVEQGILNRDTVDEVLSSESSYNKLDVYALRKKALSEPLSPEELLKVLYQIGKRRGFKSNRKVEEESNGDDSGRVTKALSINSQFLRDNKYKTVGAALASDQRYVSHKRNKRDDYSNSFSRADFTGELIKIVDVQRKHVFKDISDRVINRLIYGIDDDGRLVNQSAVMYQRPFMTKELIEKMVGNCTFEPNEKRAPKASYSFELFRLANDLVHLVYIPKDSNKRDAKRQNNCLTLTPEQIKDVIEAAKKSKALDYAKVRKAAGVSDDYVPEYIRGKVSEDDPYGEKNNFGGLKAYNDIRLALKDLPTDWQKIDNEEFLNEIAYILTVQKTDEAILDELGLLPISNDAKRAILKIKPTDFKTFGHLSIKALQKITPYLLSGNTYDKACGLAGYDFRKQGASLEQITNPVVKRAIAQTNKVVQAIIRKYGAPYFIHIETARDLAKNFRDRKTIENENKENQSKNQQIIEQLKADYNVINPTGMQITKLKLYREQNGVSLYSGKTIDLDLLLNDDNAYQVDHIVPFSRSNNDGMTNKTLVLTAENQEKANRTPFEYFGADESRWQQFEARIETTYKTRDVKSANLNGGEKHDNYKFNGYALRKKQGLLLKEYKNDSWNVRALNDTHYITRFIQNYLRQTINFAPGENKQRVFAPNGTITAYMRKRWGLSKDRSADVLHHAKDAAVIAAMNQKMIYRANLYSKTNEMKQYLSNAKNIEEKAQKLFDLTNKETGEIIDDEAFKAAQSEGRVLERKKLVMDTLSDDKFPEPWKRFREEVDWRTRVISGDDLRDKMKNFDTYDEEFTRGIEPIFVSRMPNRKATGSAHKETIRSPKVDEESNRTVRVPLMNIKSKDLENSHVKDTDPQLYQTLKSRLEKFGDNPDKAFAEPVYKKDKKGNDAHKVRAIKVASKQPSGFYINHGKAFVNNGSMVRLDVYKKTNTKGKVEHFFVPVYTYQIPLEKRGCKITRILPKPKELTDIDGTFAKVCSLYPNDYVRFCFSDKIIEGYYVKYGTASGQVSIVDHAAPSKDKDQLIQVSARSAKLIERYDISILGDNSPKA